ncbi:MAG: HAMP domain-containing histidine kinase [Limnothrix sp. RL_2_0]|nr:HAMP domain-containing histidine kinase [Limnothrix sp. RL_2_0]
MCVGDRPKITVTTTAIDADHIKICISDNGSGILPEAKAKIFEPFFSTKSIGPGTGLGLAICRQIIHRHDGAIACVSEQNCGTTFDVVLPVQAKHFEGEFVSLA